MDVCYALIDNFAQDFKRRMLPGLGCEWDREIIEFRGDALIQTQNGFSSQAAVWIPQ